MKMNSHQTDPTKSKPPLTEASQPPERISAESVAILWTRMAALFGNLWETSYGLAGGNVYKTWEDALCSNYTPAQVTRGYNAMLEAGEQFPPNLIKFLRMCRTVDPYSTHTQTEKKLDRPKPRYSVMRIEQAKQQFLFGESFGVPRSDGSHVIDWNKDDEEVLLTALAQFTPDSPLEEINRVIDYIQFSHGTQRENGYAI